MKRFSASDLNLPPFVESPRPQLHPGHAFPDFPGWLSTTAWVGQHFLFSYEDYIMAFFPCCPAVALVCARWPSQSQYFEPKLQIPKCGKLCGCFLKELSILCEDFFFFLTFKTSFLQWENANHWIHFIGKLLNPHMSVKPEKLCGDLCSAGDGASNNRERWSWAIQ